MPRVCKLAEVDSQVGPSGKNIWSLWIKRKWVTCSLLIAATTATHHDQSIMNVVNRWLAGGFMAFVNTPSSWPSPKLKAITQIHVPHIGWPIVSGTWLYLNARSREHLRCFRVDKKYKYKSKTRSKVRQRNSNCSTTPSIFHFSKWALLQLALIVNPNARGSSYCPVFFSFEIF